MHVPTYHVGVPVVCRFFGIVIAIYWEDHPLPHFHARYSGHEALIDIRSGNVIRGALPRRARTLVEEWRSLHIEDLLDNWERAEQRRPLLELDPLE